MTRGVAVAYTVLIWFYELLQARGLMCRNRFIRSAYPTPHIIAQVTLIVWSLGNKPDESELLWNVVAYSLGIFALGVFSMVLWAAPQFSFTVLMSGMGSILVFVVTSIIQNRFVQILISAPSFMLMTPLFLVRIRIPLFLIPFFTRSVAIAARDSHLQFLQYERCVLG